MSSHIAEIEDLRRRLEEERRGREQEKVRADRNEHERTQEKERADREKRERAQEKERADRNERERAQEKERADRNERERAQEKERADREERERAQEKERADRNERERAQEKERADREERERAQEKERADRNERERAQEKERADREERGRMRLEADQSPTAFLVYLQHVKEKLLSTFSVEPDPTKTSSGSVTNVHGKYYPQQLRKWADFNKNHNRMFNQFTEVFSNDPLFPPKTDVQGERADRNERERAQEKERADREERERAQEKERADRNERERAQEKERADREERERAQEKERADRNERERAQEKERADREERGRMRLEADQSPTAFLVYLQHVKEKLLSTFSVEPDPTKTSSGSVTNVHGKYYPQQLRKWADFNKNHNRMFNQFTEVFSNDPLFPPKTDVQGNNAYSLSSKHITDLTDADAIENQDAVPPSKKRSVERDVRGVPDRWGIRGLPSGDELTVFVGEYKAAHKLPSSAFDRVFSSTGESLFFDTLKRLSLPAVPDCVDDSLLNDFDVRYGPVSQLSTFVMLSLESAPQSPQWIENAKSQLYQWPILPENLILRSRSLRPETAPSSSSDEELEDKKDGSYRPGRQPRNQQPHSQSTDRTETQRRQSSRTQHRSQEPTLSYCTQACLVGLSQGHPLDQFCPNFSIHQRGTSSHNHLISKEKLCILVNNQLARNLDENCKCLDTMGMFGAVGVLFKITLTNYGYTFVAKGVQAVDEKAILNEANVYAHLWKLQGVTIPVHLGNIKLLQTYPLVSTATVTSMMLMSWAGNSLHSEDYKSDVDIEAQKQQSIAELSAAGLVHYDLRRANMGWNQERQRVMVFDFDQSSIQPSLSGRKRVGDGGASSGLAMKRTRVDRDNADVVFDEY
ncbi:hypothetical protein BDFG_08108 [Blastomyces dermatitidis ATCC 26199]|nr:hypothetical protein BDFG_08108 [Blastomyces dermatitidis ATCC 26199]